MGVRIAAALGAALMALAATIAPAIAAPEKCPRMVAQWAPVAPTASFAGSAAGWPARPDAPRIWTSAAPQTGVLNVAETEAAVRLTYVGHASFLIESPTGLTIVTDYNDYVRPSLIPQVVTMNRAHDTHYTDNPDPGIAHVLRGWNPQGGAAQHELTLGDVWIRNVPTNIRMGAGTLYDGNSVFVFEVAGLCIAHLGHLHHLLTPAHLEALGRIDVVLAPVDGSYTLDIEGMVETLKAINAPLVIPMHYFSAWGLERFLQRLGQSYAITREPTPSVMLSRATLPAQPTVMVLPGR